MILCWKNTNKESRVCRLVILCKKIVSILHIFDLVLKKHKYWIASLQVCDLVVNDTWNIFLKDFEKCCKIANFCFASFLKKLQQCKILQDFEKSCKNASFCFASFFKKLQKCTFLQDYQKSCKIARFLLCKFF